MIEPPPKKTQASVGYRDRPMHEMRCADCANWMGREACTKVQGEIRSYGWCKLWAPRKGG